MHVLVHGLFWPAAGARVLSHPSPRGCTTGSERRTDTLNDESRAEALASHLAATPMHLLAALQTKGAELSGHHTLGWALQPSAQAWFAKLSTSNSSSASLSSPTAASRLAVFLPGFSFDTFLLPQRPGTGSGSWLPGYTAAGARVQGPQGRETGWSLEH